MSSPGRKHITTSCSCCAVNNTCRKYVFSKVCFSIAPTYSVIVLVSFVILAFCRPTRFKVHSVSLCGRLYPLPRRTTLCFRNAFHLIEARNGIAYVRGIFQRLLALLGESELGCRYTITRCRC